MPEFRPFRCLVVPFIAAARLPVGAKAAPSLPQGIKQADAKCLKLKDLDAKPATPNIKAGGFEEEEESKPTNREIALGSLKAALSYRQESTGECERRRAVPASPRILSEGMITEVPDEEVNGFLAGYVGEKILLGEGKQAWALMLDYYDKASDWALDVCHKPLDTERAADFPGGA